MQQSRGTAAKDRAAVEDAAGAAPTHPAGAAARERAGAASHCTSNGRVAEYGERAHMAYDHGGIKALKPKPNGGRKHENMSVAKEKALLAQFAKAAGAGEMLNIHDLKAAY